MTDLSIHPLVLSGYGLVEASFERTADGFGAQAHADASQIRVVKVTSSAAEAVDHLSLRTHPATRLVLVDRGGWTGALTNHRNGSDFSDYQYSAARSLGVRTIRVVDSNARWWTRDGLRERLAYEARIFELHGHDDSTLRSITCADDGGRWVFETSGSPLPIEASFDYDAPRKKDRFTRNNLRALLTAVGPGPLTDATFLKAPRFGLLAERWMNDAWRARIEAAACSLEEADDPAFGYYQVGMSYVDYLDTHATSVIASFERAIAINPAYEPRVREYLRQARRIAGN
jgi:hypothetical protein